METFLEYLNSFKIYPVSYGRTKSRRSFDGRNSKLQFEWMAKPTLRFVYFLSQTYLPANEASTITKIVDVSLADKNTKRTFDYRCTYIDCVVTAFKARLHDATKTCDVRQNRTM